MANNVFANGREISCKKADGKSICAFPDVCFTPPQTPATPPGVPVPYPNTGYAKDTTKGSKTVKISGKEVMLKNKSYFKKSTGDEAGSAAKKGVVTGVNRGKVYFNSWSMNVKIEGKNVVRHLDLTTHNHASPPGQTPPGPYIDSEDVERYSRKARNKANRMNCAQLLEKINELTDCEKVGRSGTKGLIQRIRDYVGDDATHGPQILSQQRALKTYLEAYRDRSGKVTRFPFIRLPRLFQRTSR